MSQYNQDQILNNEIFKNKKNGFFVDVGAHDGVSLSNSLFYENMGWNGICVEPIHDRFVKLCKNRKCICIEGCAYNSNCELDFIELTGYTEMLSGILQTYDPRHIGRINREISTKGGNAVQKKMKAFPLKEIFEQNNVLHIDYLSIDTEGSEFQVLEGIDFDKVTIDVIDVENNYKDSFDKIHNLLISKGFVHFKTIHCDEIYVNANFKF